MRSGARARTAAPKVTRPIAHTASMRFIEPPSGDAGADELLDSIDDVFDVELRRIDPLGVLGGLHARGVTLVAKPEVGGKRVAADRKSTRLNSSHQIISYAVFCLKKKKKTTQDDTSKKKKNRKKTKH